MKEFKYSLETVLNYKTQVLDNLTTEHAEIIHNVNKKKNEIQQLNQDLFGFETKYREVKSAGAPIERFLLHNMCIDRMEEIIDKEEERLHTLQEAEEAKKKEVITARVDTSKFEKLKDRKYQDYRKELSKSEERYVEEIVAHTVIDRKFQGVG